MRYYGSSFRMRCAGLLMTILGDVTSIDPAFARASRTFLTRRFRAKSIGPAPGVIRPARLRALHFRTDDGYDINLVACTGGSALLFSSHGCFVATLFKKATNVAILKHLSARGALARNCRTDFLKNISRMSECID